MRLGIVTCSKCRDLTASEQPLIPLLAGLNIEASAVVWNDPKANWESYDAFLVRSIWDYHLSPDEFLSWLSRIEALDKPVWNPASVLRWNSHKFYLRDLATRGVNVVPTLFMQRGSKDAKTQASSRGWTDVVLKPAVSASSYKTHVVSVTDQDADARFAEMSDHGDFLVQPLLTSIRDKGEVSLVFFNNVFSHAVLKRPGANEFRVQTEFGGHASLHSVSPDIIQAGQQVLLATRMELLYARVDGIIEDGKPALPAHRNVSEGGSAAEGFVLMELELIEPDLFLNLRPGSDREFAAHVTRRLRPLASS